MKIKMILEKEINKGRIINKLDESSYIYWIDEFVERVLKQSRVSYEEAVINSIEAGKRIFLIIDDIEYTIRTWDFIVTDIDTNNRPTKAMINYTLYKMEENHGKVILEGTQDIEMKVG